MIAKLEAIIAQAKRTEFLYCKKDFQKTNLTNEQIRKMAIEFMESQNKLNAMKEEFLNKFNKGC